MKKLLMILCAMLLLVGIIDTSNAALIDRGGGLIYDTDLSVTWLQDASYYLNHGGTGDEADLTYWGARYYVESLQYYDPVRDITWSESWRLPKASIDNTYPSQGYNIINSEMGHLFYESLDNQAGSLQNSGPFINFSSGKY